MIKFETDKKNTFFDCGDFIGDIISKSIGVKSAPEQNRLEKPRSLLDLVPHNSLEDLQNMTTNVCKLGEGPTDVLSKSATIQCINCGNMAKNLAYLENYIKSNASKKSGCSTCTTALSFLEYLNKNIESVFNNINSAGLYVLEQQAVLPSSKNFNQTNFPFTKAPVKKPLKESHPVKSTISPKAKKAGPQIIAHNSGMKPIGKGTKSAKNKSKIKKNTSQLDDGNPNSARPKIKKLRKRPKSPTKFTTRSEQSTAQK